MNKVCISASGLFTPPNSISNDELVESFNAWVDRFNAENAADIEAGLVTPLQPSSSEFITKASGIKARYAMDKTGILNVDQMHPQIELRSNDEPSQLVEMALPACRQALERAGRKAEDVDLILVACSNLQRPYPAVSIELQHYLGAGGYAYDMNVACASATFGLQAAFDAIRLGTARCALVVSPELMTGHLNFRNRDCHFIFGDAAVATVVEPLEQSDSKTGFEILGARSVTRFSSNIRNNFGFLNRSEQPARSWDDKLFTQEGRKVFKEVVPLVAELITGHLAEEGLSASDVRRFWLHQANLSMNNLIAKRVLGREPTKLESPVILDEYANTSSAGSIVAFHKHHEDLASGDLGVLCAFGAGYSAGSVLVRRL